MRRRTYYLLTISAFTIALLLVSFLHMINTKIAPKDISGAVDTKISSVEKAVHAEYIKKWVSLENIRVEGGNEAIAGSVINSGEKNIWLLRIAVKFGTESGEELDKREYTIVSVASMLNPTEPLRPGSGRDFEYFIQDYAPLGWKGMVEVEVSDLKFEEEVRREFNI